MYSPSTQRLQRSLLRRCRLAACRHDANGMLSVCTFPCPRVPGVAWTLIVYGAAAAIEARRGRPSPPSLELGVLRIPGAYDGSTSTMHTRAQHWPLLAARGRRETQTRHSSTATSVNQHQTTPLFSLLSLVLPTAPFQDECAVCKLVYNSFCFRIQSHRTWHAANVLYTVGTHSRHPQLMHTG